jgi:hypothetical protein
MPLNFFCPHCAAQTLVDDEYAGRSGQCFSCGKPISVPPNPAAGGASARRAPPAAPRDRPAARIGLLLALIAAGLVGAGMVLALVIQLFQPYVELAQTRMAQTTCDRNLQQLARALHSYHQKYGSFPPASVTDGNGKVMHSWRVLILPELGETQLYRQYDFKQPWNSPANLEFAKRMPAVFACPGNPDALAANETTYMVLVGKKTAFPGPDQVTRQSQFDDGLGTTILFVETQTTGVLWTQPEDLDADTIKFDINSQRSDGIGSNHPEGAHVVTANGRVHFLQKSSPPDYVKAMSTIAARDQVPSNLLEND